MEYHFEKFRNRNARLEDKISITKSHSIGFPTKFYKDNNISNYKYVVLYYDRSNKSVGIRFTNDETEENSYSISHSKQGYGGSVVVRSFFNTYDIDPEEYHGKYEWKKHQLEGVGQLFIIELTQKDTEKSE